MLTLCRLRDEGDSDPDYHLAWERHFAIAHDPSALRCESNHGKESICPLPAGARVRVQEQRSNTPCVEGKNWDVRSVGLHVSHGCRADFHVL